MVKAWILIARQAGAIVKFETRHPRHGGVGEVGPVDEAPPAERLPQRSAGGAGAGRLVARPRGPAKRQGQPERRQQQAGGDEEAALVAHGPSSPSRWAWPWEIGRAHV